ncbi:MAG: LemA family protein [Gammaproteobacteria bacterium]|nr:LemA family protein [Gammaproteobacteria bacterium]
MGFGWVLLIIVAVVAGFAWMTYNRLVNLRNRVKNAFSQISVQLTRRHDLIPNLVESVKGYMQHERQTLEEVVSARSAAVNGLGAAMKDPANAMLIKEVGGLENALSSALSKLFALSESYPDLKANENVIRLQEELTTTENKVAFSRQAYNDSVMTLNNGVEQFPANFIATMFNFRKAEFLEIEEGKETVPQVNLAA